MAAERAMKLYFTTLYLNEIKKTTRQEVFFLRGHRENVLATQKVLFLVEYRNAGKKQLGAVVTL